MLINDIGGIGMRTELEKAEMELRKWDLNVSLMYLKRDLRDLKKELDPRLMWKAEEIEKEINELKERISNIS
jgi:predicted  nucleic acid-binding Zn-ribbon protein